MTLPEPVEASSHLKKTLRNVTSEFTTELKTIDNTDLDTLDVGLHIVPFTLDDTRWS